MNDTRSPRIFSTDKGIVMVQSETKNLIIDFLIERDMTGAEIREELDKAKSTVSVHLSDLTDLGIIDEKDHPDDERKKLFYLKSKLLGQSEAPYDEHYKKILANLKGSKGDEYEFLKSLFHLIRYGLISFGLDIHPALKEIGRDAGRSIGQGFNSKTKENALKEIADLWEDTGLGTIKTEESDYLVIEDCFDCDEMPDVGHTLCSLDEGIIEGIIEETLDKKVIVTEKECHATGADHCKFDLEWNGEKPD
ncbi:MAG: ArsR family transcriptional regulator [Candidatus Thermoplasmatota archaeon]|nr:ArsR family transcriptional regulator [Candidatus Thermoplasmatota archaeon]